MNELLLARWLRRARKRRPSHGSLGLVLLSVAMLGALLAALGVGAVLASAQFASAIYSGLHSQLPAVGELASHQAFKTARIYDRNGELLWEFWDLTAGNRTVVPLAAISPALVDATLAAEDANFYGNPGVDLRGILRAVFLNVQEHDVVSGGSTITQQLVRNVLLDPRERFSQTLQRKIREAMLAYQVNDRFSKDQVLEMYLNEIYFGNLAYGVEAAAQVYFNKSARDLTVAEAALIAGLPQAPSLYDPYTNPRLAVERRGHVLDLMARNAFVTEAEADNARREPLRLVRRTLDIRAPHWVAFIREEVERDFGPDLLYRGGLKIFSTLDLQLQRRLEQVAANNTENLAQRLANNTAIVAMDPRTGEVLAMVGSMDYWNDDIEGQINMAVSERQPGSSIKPLVYMTAFSQGENPATILMDAPGCWRDLVGTNWCPQNFDNRFRGPMTARAALGNSLNLPAVRLLEKTGIGKVREMAQKAGIETWNDGRHLGLSLTLGGAEVRPLDLTGFYATLANNGLRLPPVSITRIEDASGKLLKNYRVPQGEQIVDPRAAYMVTHILSDNTARLATFGPNSLINMPRPAAVKTGTTDRYRDTWALGYTPNLVVGVWVGNSDGRLMREILSSMSAGKVWREAMDVTIEHLGLPAEEFTRPDGLAEVQVCAPSAARPGLSPCYPELFFSEKLPHAQAGPIYLQGAEPPTPTPTATPTEDELKVFGTATAQASLPTALPTPLTVSTPGPGPSVERSPTAAALPVATAAPASPVATPAPTNTPVPTSSPAPTSMPASGGGPAAKPG